MASRRGLKTQYARTFFDMSDADGTTVICRRCSLKVHIPTDPVTKRPNLVPCADHLFSTTGQQCAAGVMHYDADAAWFALFGSGTTEEDARRLVDEAVDFVSQSKGPVLLLLNPKTPANFGSILRACGCMAVGASVLYTGNRLDIAMKYQEASFREELGAQGGNRSAHGASLRTDTMAAGRTIPQLRLTRVADVDALILKLHTSHPETRCVAVDMIANALSLPIFDHYLSDDTVTTTVYILGPEDGSIPASIVGACDAAVFINTTGSLNLSATVNVLLYDRLSKIELRDILPTSEKRLRVEMTRSSNNRTTK